MKLVKPITIDSDSVLISSNIAEPDLSTGEAEWVDPSIVVFFENYTESYLSSAIAKDKKDIYCVGNSGVAIQINIENKFIQSFGSYSGSYYTSTLANDDYIYCVGDGGEVLRLDIGGTASTFGSFSLNYYAASLANDGNIYCVGDSGVVLEIDIPSQTTSTFGSYNDFYFASALANDGNIYCVGDGGVVLKINPNSKGVSTFGTYFGEYRSASLANDGNIYCVGASGVVLKIDVANQTTSTFGSYAGVYRSSSVGVDGNIYCVGDSGVVLEIDVANKSLSEFGSYSNSYYSLHTGVDGNIYCVGDSGVVAEIKRPYLPEENAIKTSTHKIYQATKTTRDNPEIGVNLAVPSWIEVSATNKYKPFDDVVGTQVESDTGTISYEILPGEIVGGIAGLNLENATSVNVVMNDPTYGEVYNNTLALLDESNVVDAYSYWWSDFKYKTVFTMLDLPSFKNATITVTITGSGTVKAGVIIVGPSFDLGTTLHGTNTKLLDYSTYNEDSFGNITVTKRVPAKLVNFMVSVQSKDDLDDVYEILESMVGEYGLYIGEEENAKEMTTAFGLHRNITLSKDEPTLNKYTLQIRGLT